MGRTARAGAEGSALSFISPADNRMWRDIEKLLGIKSNDNDGGERRGGRGGKPSYGQKKPFEKKGRWKKTGGPDGRSFEGKKRDDLASTGEKKPWGDKPRSNDGAPKKTWGDKPRFEKTEGGAKPNGFKKKTWGDKPAADGQKKKTWGDKPRSADGAPKKTWGDKPRSAEGAPKKTWGEKPRSADGAPKKKTWGDKPKSNGQGKSGFKDKPRSGQFKRKDNAA